MMRPAPVGKQSFGPKPRAEHQLCNLADNMRHAEQTIDSEDSPPDERPPEAPHGGCDQGNHVGHNKADKRETPKSRNVLAVPGAAAGRTGKLTQSSGANGRVRPGTTARKRSHNSGVYDRLTARRPSYLSSAAPSMFSSINGSEGSLFSPLASKHISQVINERTRHRRNGSVECMHSSHFSARVVERRSRVLPQSPATEKAKPDAAETRSLFRGKRRASQEPITKSGKKEQSPGKKELKRPPQKLRGPKYTSADVAGARVIVIDLENLDRLVGRRKLDKSGLRKGVPRKETKLRSGSRSGGDANNRYTLYLYP